MKDFGFFYQNFDICAHILSKQIVKVLFETFSIERNLQIFAEMHYS